VHDGDVCKNQRLFGSQHSGLNTASVLYRFKMYFPDLKREENKACPLAM